MNYNVEILKENINYQFLFKKDKLFLCVSKLKTIDY